MERIVEQIVDENLIKEKLEKVIKDELPLGTRVILEGFAEGGNINQQARKLGISGPTAGTRFHRGVVLLKNRLRILIEN